ncbi:MAG: CHAT domain-containing protein [Bryobacteraceae bacterium]|nr:CHAT domain-containing protein [Bryobacteraceae bacterium]
MRRIWWISFPLLLATSAAGLWWRWPHLQLARAESALRAIPAPHSLYWPGYEPGTPPLTLAERAEALARLATSIEAAERRLGPTPRSLYLRGRLASLRGGASEAIRLCRLAALLEPADAGLQMAHGVALGIRAGAENRALDWATAADVLLAAAELPGFPALGYADLAQVSEQLPAPHAALAAWKKAAADPALQSVFAGNVQRVENEFRARQERIAEVAERRQPSRDVPGSAELLLQIALTDWLPRRAEFAADLDRLAAFLRTQRRDATLADLLRAAPQAAADQALARAVDATVRGDYSAAAESGLAASGLYAANGNAAGQALAALHASLGLRRSNRAGECLVPASLALKLATARAYPWAALRAAQEAMACKATQQVIDVQLEREDLAARSQASSYLDLELRGLSMLVEPSRGFTAPAESWARGQRGFTSYWRSTLPAPFSTNFYSPLGLMAESFGYTRLATLLFEEAMAAMDGHPNQWLRDAIRSDFFRLNPSVQRPGRVTSEVEAASREVAAGQARLALSRLAKVTQGAEFPYRQLDLYERMNLLPVLGRALWSQGQRTEALRHFRAVVDESVATVQALKGRRQRYATTLTVAPAWRQLVDAELATVGAEASLRTWQTFRTLPNPGQAISLSTPAGEARLAIALLPAGPAVWWSDAQGIAVTRLAIPDLVNRSQRFAALAANPDSPLPAVQESARELYRLILGPFEERLANVRTLVIDPDGPLAVLPWGALLDAQGRALLSRVALIQTIGWGSPAVSPPNPDWQPALVVAEPAVAPHDRARFPILAAARGEAERLRELFPHHLYLSGDGANVAALQQELAHHRLFHFAGHGVANGGNGALVLAGEPLLGTRLITANEIAELDLRTLRLATLAACSSGTGEDRGAVNVESLVQAFLDAGAGQVLASRWNVDSSATSQVMRGFYLALRQGASPAVALREATVASIASQPHPYYWAPFQLYGHP